MGSQCRHLECRSYGECVSAKTLPSAPFFLLSTHSQSSRCGIFLRTDTCLTLLIPRMGKCPQLTTLRRWLRISDCLHGSISIEAKSQPRFLTNMVSSFYFLILLSLQRTCSFFGRFAAEITFIRSMEKRRRSRHPFALSGKFHYYCF